MCYLWICRKYKIVLTEKFDGLYFSFNEGKKTIVYQYEVSEVMEENEIQQILKVTSVNDMYTQYKVSYTKQYFTNGTFQKQEEAIGDMQVKEGKLTFTNEPLLKEGMEANRALLERFEEKFAVHYDKYDFIHLPQSSKQANIPVMNEMAPTVSTTVDYYAQPHINAKGYSLVKALVVDKSMQSVIFSEYVIEQKAYSYQNTIELEKRSDAIYQLVQIDPDVNYVVYFVGDSAYMYEQSLSDEDIRNDVASHNANQALVVLKTSNQKYP